MPREMSAPSSVDCTDVGAFRGHGGQFPPNMAVTLREPAFFAAVADGCAVSVSLEWRDLELSPHLAVRCVYVDGQAQRCFWTFRDVKGFVLLNPGGPVVIVDTPGLADIPDFARRVFLAVRGTARRKYRCIHGTDGPYRRYYPEATHDYAAAMYVRRRGRIHIFTLTASGTVHKERSVAVDDALYCFFRDGAWHGWHDVAPEWKSPLFQ